MFAQFFLWGEEVESRSLPTAIGVLQSLTDKQVNKLPERFEESNLELAEDEMEGDLNEHQQRWGEEFESTLERFTGNLNKAQLTVIANQSKRYQPERLMWAEYRRNWQAELLELLVHRDKDTFPAQFQALVKSRESYYSPEFQVVNDANQKLGLELLSQVLNSLDNQQSERFQRRINELAQDLRELSEKKT